MRVLIADDEPLALERLSKLFREIGGVEIVAQARDGLEAAALIAEHRPDIAFLDIRMPGRNGMALARALAADSASATEVVFVTAYDQFAAEAFDLDAVDYLLKPVATERLAAAITRARRRRLAAPAADAVAPETSDETYASGLWVRRRDGMVRVPIAAIDWIEAAGDYVLIHTPSRSHMLRSTMEALQKQLDPGAIIRVSRSAFVRRDAVTAIRTVARGGLALVVAGQAETMVGHTYARAVRRAFGLKTNEPACR